MAEVLHQGLNDIKLMTVEEFDDAIDYIKRTSQEG